jgi:hypothetical protein
MLRGTRRIAGISRCVVLKLFSALGKKEKRGRAYYRFR